jgi:dTDP-4-amino-4,6-dideoxygalactose transaminase
MSESFRGVWPSYTEEEIDAVAKVLRSGRVNYWTGSECKAFEHEFAEWTGVAHAVALSNGTVALEVALRALGVGAGDDVVVTPRSFVASASCVAMLGARPVFADVDPTSQNISAETIREVLTPAARAVVCVHLAGRPCDMDPISELAKRHGLKVVEDCAQAHGARYRGRSVGSIGDVGAWSFCQDKIMTTGGEGGMITTNDPDVWSKAWSYKDHGKSWNSVYEDEHKPGFRWLHRSVGTNGRMLELQAAIGRLQLRNMREWTRRRNENAAHLAEACRPFKVVSLPPVPNDVVHAYYRFYVFVECDYLVEGWSRDRIIAEIVDRGVPCFHGSCPEIYLEGAFDSAAYRPASRLPAARELGETSLCFLVHPTLSNADLERTCSAISEVLAMADKSAP